MVLYWEMGKDSILEDIDRRSRNDGNRERIPVINNPQQKRKILSSYLGVPCWGGQCQTVRVRNQMAREYLECDF